MLQMKEGPEDSCGQTENKEQQSGITNQYFYSDPSRSTGAACLWIKDFWTMIGPHQDQNPVM